MKINYELIIFASMIAMLSFGFASMALGAIILQSALDGTLDTTSAIANAPHITLALTVTSMAILAISTWKAYA